MKGKIICGRNGKPDRYEIDGKEVTEKEWRKAFPLRDHSVGAGEGLIGWKPLVSDGLAVHPKQVKEAIEDARKKGVPVDFLPDGRPVFTSREQRKNYMRAYGFFDKHAGYGDAADGSFRGDRPDKPDPARDLCDDLGGRVTRQGKEELVREIMERSR